METLNQDAVPLTVEGNPEEDPEERNGAAPLPEGEAHEDEECPEFECWFAEDIEPRTFPFRIGGRDAFVSLKPMDGQSSDAFQMIGFSLRFDGTQMKQGGGSLGDGEQKLDMSKRNLFLVSNTLVDFRLWRKSYTRGGEEVWDQVRPPARHDGQVDRSKIPAIIRDAFRTDAKPWRWLVRKCMEVNGLLEAEQDKSGPRSE